MIVISWEKATILHFFLYRPKHSAIQNELPDCNINNFAVRNVMEKRFDHKSEGIYLHYICLLYNFSSSQGQIQSACLFHDSKHGKVDFYAPLLNQVVQ